MHKLKKVECKFEVNKALIRRETYNMQIKIANTYLRSCEADDAYVLSHSEV